MGGNARLLAQLKLLLRTDLRWNISFKIILPFKHRHEFHRVSLEVTGKYFPQWFFPVRAWGLQQEPKELNHIFNPDEHSALGYGGMLDTWPSTSRSLPKHVEDNGYIIINSMGFKLFSQFPLLSSHFDSSVEKKDLDFSLTSTAIQTRGLLWERHEWRCLPPLPQWYGICDSLHLFLSHAQTCSSCGVERDNLRKQNKVSLLMVCKLF